ncbi:related to RTS2 - Basic zinc-finger protein, involved in UV response and DNA replication [Melanopsichium pennsylvanicum]|uniref:Related to RTS2 - Basic zinc-finger protein, involved in UV response and DNA replication n=2 Tax=Melanopsichium pennsylvanicum TaxID=63383 RepID=A0AAJ4XHX8_9BASI|nr:related to RTS2-Basic zinc-finger protein, involved in UV response and DNA replication [Melanopsichium pennsylvanicum 4]SNX82326.1 related to RTS2 - Basic zinc-finger protein, involved in UV response and DNA replication [Melanopsichium pennsylvanicum]
MGKAEAGSLKAISNAIKAKGLTKLRFYCQICQKACRDENGYRSHLDSEAHFRQIDAIASSGGAQKVIDDFSATFQEEFVQLLSRRFGTRRVRANQVYQEHIADRHHTHMNATQWTSLSEFVKHLGREGIVQAEDTEQGWYITWIDNSPAALARQDALQKMERAKMDDEQRQRRLLEEQIARASQANLQGSDKAQTARVQRNSEASDAAPQGLQRTGSGPIRIGISLGSLSRTAEHPNDSSESSDRTQDGMPAEKCATATTTQSTSASSAPTPFKMGFNVLKSASKPANPLKQADRPRREDCKGSGRLTSISGGKARFPSGMTMAEKIMHEELERKKRKDEAPTGRSAGPQMQQGIKRSRF